MSPLRSGAGSALVALTLGAALAPGPTSATPTVAGDEPRHGDRLHVVDHGSHHHLPATTTAAAAPRPKVAATRKAYRSAAAAEKRALKRLNAALRSKRNAHRAWDPAMMALDSAQRQATAAVSNAIAASTRLAATEEDAADAASALSEALAGTDASAIEAAQTELDRAAAEVTSLRGTLAAATSAVTRLRQVEQNARQRLADVEAATRVDTTPLAITYERAKKRTFTTRVRFARAKTPAASARHPYKLVGTGKKVWFWDACQGPITVKVSTPALTGSARRAAASEARRAVTTAARASRLPLVYRGTTTEVPTLSTQVKSADIVITYTSARHSPDLGLDGTRLGMGGSWSRLSERGETTRFAGFAAVDATTTSATRRGRSPLRAAVVLHELGHAIGLSHVTDTGELMHPRASASSRHSFGKGDLNGLKRLRAYSRC